MTIINLNLWPAQSPQWWKSPLKICLVLAPCLLPHSWPRSKSGTGRSWRWGLRGLSLYNVHQYLNISHHQKSINEIMITIPSTNSPPHNDVHQCANRRGMVGMAERLQQRRNLLWIDHWCGHSQLIDEHGTWKLFSPHHCKRTPVLWDWQGTWPGEWRSPRWWGWPRPSWRSQATSSWPSSQACGGSTVFGWGSHCPKARNWRLWSEKSWSEITPTGALLNFENIFLSGKER